MAGNQEIDLAKDMKFEQENLEESKYYENVNLELEKIALENTLIEEKHRKENKDGVEKETLEYNVYIKFKGEDIKIATISEDGKLIPNKALLEDEKFSEEDKAALGDMLNTLGLEQGKVDINKLQDELKKLEAKTKEELENNRKKDKEETTKDELDGEEKEEEKQKTIEDLEEEGKNKVLGKRLGIGEKRIARIRDNSQTKRNFPNMPNSAFIYLDNNGKPHMGAMGEGGKLIPDVQGFEESLERPIVTSFGEDGQDVKQRTPYKVMTAEGLGNTNRNTQEVRIAIYIDADGRLEIETLHQGGNGEWEGKPVETYGRDRTTGRVDKLIEETYSSPRTGSIAERADQLKNSGFSQDGITIEEMSKERKIDEYMRDGYTEEEANKIYSYVVGELELNENDAKTKVNIEANEENDGDAENDGGRTPWGDAEDRRRR